MANSADTIFALSTPYAKSGVALFRISGRSALSGLTTLGFNQQVTPRTASLAWLKNSLGEAIDQVLVTYFPSPKSFTGEEVVEIAGHGSLAVIDSLINEFSAISGWRQAEAGEFSRRAFRNGKMDLAQSEGLADMLDARSPAQLQLAQKQAWGSLTDQVKTWREKLVGLQALAEASIDFAEDLDEDIDQQIRQQCTSVASELSSALQAGQASMKLKSGYVIALVGAPNAGKSSLLNALTQREMAIVTDIPGTTRDSIGVDTELGGLPVRLVDTAGIRDTDDVVERAGVDRSLSLVAEADLAVEILGPSTVSDPKLSADLIVRTHADVSRETEFLAVSSTTGEGLSQLKSAVVELLTQNLPDPSQVAFVQARQQAAVRRAVEDLGLAAVAPSLDLVGQHLRYAAGAMAEITGDVDVEDILDVVFGSFCIGK